MLGSRLNAPRYRSTLVFGVIFSDMGRDAALRGTRVPFFMPHSSGPWIILVVFRLATDGHFERASKGPSAKFGLF